MRRLGSVRVRLLLMVTAVVLAAVLVVGWSSRRVTRAEFRQLMARIETEVEGAAEEGGAGEHLQALGDRIQDDFRRSGDWRGASDTLRAAGPAQGRPSLLVADGDRLVAASDDRLAAAKVSTGDDGALHVKGWWRARQGPETEVANEQEIVFHGPSRPIRTAAGEVAAVLYVLPPSDAFGERLIEVAGGGEFLGTIDRWMLGVVIAVGLAALAAAAVLSARIVGPIETITAAARRMGAGQLDQRVDVASHDEIGELATAFNVMAASLQRNERLRRDMVSDVAHELRTPLTNLRGQLESVQDGLLAATPELVASLHEETMLLSRLVDDLQELALADAGQLGLDPESIDVAAELERAAALFAPSMAAATTPSAGTRNIELSLDPDLPAARADRQRLRQVLANLIDNAMRHGGGDVTLSASALPSAPAAALTAPPAAPAGFVQITVADRGPGIAGQHLADVFERFYRVDPSRQRATGGAGLGLAIVRQLVELQGGCVWVKSQPGVGSTFGACLPVASSDLQGGAPG